MYKLAALNGVPKMKLTGEPAKSSLPGAKRVWRAADEDGHFALDVLTMGDEPRAGERVSDPTNPLRSIRLPDDLTWQDAREVVMEGGRRTGVPETLPEVQARAREELGRLPAGTLRPLNPHVYRVSLGGDVAALRDRVADSLRAHAG